MRLALHLALWLVRDKDLRTTEQSVDEIASSVGYADGVTLRTLLRKKTGRGIRELRARTYARG